MLKGTFRGLSSSDDDVTISFDIVLFKHSFSSSNCSSILYVTDARRTTNVKSLFFDTASKCIENLPHKHKLNRGQKTQ